MNNRALNSDEYFIGKEPYPDDTPFLKALNWYSNQKSFEDSKQYTLKHLSTNNYSPNIIKKLEKLPDYTFVTIGFICRMLSRGYQLPENKFNYIDDKILELYSIVIEEPKSTTTVQKRVQDNSLEYINFIEGKIDEFVIEKNLDFNFYLWYTSNQVKAINAKHIIDYYTPKYEEIELALQDTEVREYYSNFNKVQLKRYSILLQSIIDDANKIIQNNKATKKPKKKKSKSVEKQIEKLSFKKEDKELKLISINPINIISASILLVYNTKYKKLGIYFSKDDKGFSIKGTTLLNFDEEISIEKILRKPEEYLPRALTDPKPTIKKLLSTVKTREIPLTGRIGNETILLRVFK